MAVAAAELIQTYQFVDDIPDVAAARDDERLAAEGILARRRFRQAQGCQPVEAPVDPLSTARAVNEAPEEDRAQLYQGLQLDCQRLVAEWYRKKRPEYFPPVRHVFDTEKQEFFSHGLSIRQMTENALLPISEDPEEEARRVNERVEDATPQLLRGLGKIATGQSIRTISECTDSAITSYNHDMQHGLKHRGYRGYVPEIEKLMIRDIRLSDDSHDRYEEQIGLPGVYITHDIIQLTLASRGAVAEHMDKTALHGSQLLVEDDLMSFAEALDNTASEQWGGVNLFMGEVVEADHPKDYATFRSEALQRQDGLKHVADEVALFALELEQQGVSRTEALTQIENFIIIKLGFYAQEDQRLGEQMFDHATAAIFVEAGVYQKNGNYEKATELFNKAVSEAPRGGACGGGSCGLESVNEKSNEGQRIKDSLRAKSGDTITKDTERSCKNCGTKNLYYAHNVGKVNTYCDGCGSFRSKKSAPVSQAA